MDWYSKTTSAGYNDSSMIERGSPDIVELALTEPGLSSVVTVWDNNEDAEIPPRKRRRQKRRQEKRRRLMEGREPAVQKGNLPTSAMGNAPDGTGRN